MVFNCEQPQVVVPLADYEVVCLPYMLWGGTEGGVSGGEARASEFPDDAVEETWVGSDGRYLGHMGVDLRIPR